MSVFSEKKAPHPGVDYAADSVSGHSESTSSDVEKFVGTQLVQESEHAIKYRTCSWQKVRFPQYFPRVVC